MTLDTAADGRPGAARRELAAPGRSTALDALRGLAIACMVADHVALFAGADTVRLTVGRLAMPVFFLLGGHLVRRWSPRTFLLVPGVGVLLEAVAPWSGAGGLLLTFTAGAAVVLLARRCPPLLWLAVLAGLTLAANGWSELDGPYYDARASVALMCAGALLPRELLHAAGSRLPRALAVAGRWPLTVYAGHVLLLEAVL